MATEDATPIMIERATEQLRQEREVFDLRKSQEARWFVLQITMGWASVFLLIAVIVICAYVLLNNTNFDEFTVKAAGAAIFVDVVGLIIGIWKIVLKPDLVTKLTPETQQELGEADELE